MALAPYRMAGAALAAGAGYQGYVQALPVLEVMIDPRSVRGFLKRQVRKLAAWAMDGDTKETEQGKSQPKPRNALPAEGEIPQPSMLEGLRQLAAQNQGLFTFLSLAALWVCAQALQILQGTCWAVTTATSWVWNLGVVLFRLARWPVLAITRIGSEPEEDNGAARCIHLCRCGLPCARSRQHHHHALDAACLCDVCINVRLRPAGLPKGNAFEVTPESNLSEAQKNCRGRRGFNWTEPERLIQSGVFKGVPYAAMLADVSYMDTVRRQGQKPGMRAALAYMSFVKHHEDAVEAGRDA